MGQATPTHLSYTQRPVIVRGDISSSPRAVSTLGLAHERLNLDAVGLPQSVIQLVTGDARCQQLRVCKTYWIKVLYIKCSSRKNTETVACAFKEF